MGVVGGELAGWVFESVFMGRKVEIRYWEARTRKESENSIQLVHWLCFVLDMPIFDVMCVICMCHASCMGSFWRLAVYCTIHLQPTLPHLPLPYFIHQNNLATLISRKNHRGKNYWEGRTEWFADSLFLLRVAVAAVMRTPCCPCCHQKSPAFILTTENYTESYIGYTANFWTLARIISHHLPTPVSITWLIRFSICSNRIQKSA